MFRMSTEIACKLSARNLLNAEHFLKMSGTRRKNKKKHVKHSEMFDEPEGKAVHYMLKNTPETEYEKREIARLLEISGVKQEKPVMPKPPPGLKGRQLGEYYKNLRRQRKEEELSQLPKENPHFGNTPGPSRLRPPPHLKGRDIGIWFSNLKRRKRDVNSESEIAKINNSKKKSADITLSKNKIQEIRFFLDLPADQQHGQQNIFNNFVNDPNIKSRFKDEYLRVIGTNMKTILEERFSMLENEPKILCEDFEDELRRSFLRTKQENRNYIKMQKVREKLPAFSRSTQILNLMNGNQVILVKGETGCGKTTQIPQFILDEALLDNRGSQCNIVCTQPRRISAITLAERVAAERGESLGQSVGYQIRLEARIPIRNGSIMYCTTGVILQFMQSDPCLSKYSHIILDEIHERDVVTDMLLGIIKMILPYRKDLKVILMSATLTAEKFSKYFHDCPIAEIPGTIHPVQEFFMEEILQELNFYHFKASRSETVKISQFNEFIKPYIAKNRERFTAKMRAALCDPNSEGDRIDLITELVYYIVKTKPEGAILVFLPSLALISDVQKNLVGFEGKLSREKVVVHPLHSRLTQVEQKDVFLPPPSGFRKIILSTNIAETSVTIEDVVYVINAGKHKLKTYEDNVSQLRDEWISLSNETQRKGRAGRVRDGYCYHLYSRARQDTFPAEVLPEILRVALDEVILPIKILCLGDVRTFLSTLLDQPNETYIEKSLDLLRQLNALDGKENLTPLGYHLAKLPMDAKTGKMILLASIFSCIDPITSVAASLTFKDAFCKPFGMEKEVDRVKLKFANNACSDHLMLANVISEFSLIDSVPQSRNFCYKNFLNHSTLKQLSNMKGQFGALLHQAKFLENNNVVSASNNIHSGNTKLLKSIICAGLYPNIAFVQRVIKKKNCPDGRALLKIEGHNRVNIHSSSVNGKLGHFDSNFVVYHVLQKVKSLVVFDTTVVEPFPLLFFGDTKVETEGGIHYISIAGQICLKCNKETLDLITDLRKCFDALLQRKICEPSPVDWNGEDGTLLRAIISLITIDGKFNEGYDDEDDNFDEDFDDFVD